MKKIILILSVVAFVCSCSAPKATSYSYLEYKTLPLSPSVFALPVMAELSVSNERITYAERINKSIKTMTDAEVEALAASEKETVIANAVKANNADVLVAPTVNITTDASNYLVIVVCGYPAVYKNFRTATVADTVFIKGAEQSATDDSKSIFPISLPIKKK